MRTADCRNPATESLISKTTVDLNTKLWGSTIVLKGNCVKFGFAAVARFLQSAVS